MYLIDCPEPFPEFVSGLLSSARGTGAAEEWLEESSPREEAGYHQRIPRDHYGPGTLPAGVCVCVCLFVCACAGEGFIGDRFS